MFLMVQSYVPPNSKIYELFTQSKLSIPLPTFCPPCDLEVYTGKDESTETTPRVEGCQEAV